MKEGTWRQSGSARRSFPREDATDDPISEYSGDARGPRLIAGGASVSGVRKRDPIDAWKVLALAASIGLLILGASPREAPARSYARPQPDPWYTIAVEFDPRSFPPGVTTRKREVRLPFYQGRERRRTLHNESATPLHLVRTLSGPPDWLGHVPPNEVAVRKFLGGKGHRIDFEKDVWTPGHPEDRLYLSEILVDPREQVIGTMGPGRPGSPVPPPPRTVRFRAIHGDRELILTATLIYEVNPEYDPGRNNEYYNLNWFRIRSVELDPAQFPAGVRIAEDRSSPHALLKLFIVNDGPTPLWVTARSPEPVAWVIQFPPGKIPYMKLAQDRVWWFRKPSKGYGQAGDVGGLVESSDPGNGWTIDERYVIRESGVASRQVQADDRPAQVEVPAPQDFALQAFYGDSPVALRGKIVYALNERYRPDAGRGPMVMASCTGFTCPGAERQLLFLPALLAGLAVLNLVFFGARRRQGERRLSITLGVVVSFGEAFLLYVAFIAISTWVFANSVQWVGLQGHTLVALMLGLVYLALSLPLLLRYRCSVRTASLFLVTSVLLLRGIAWLSGYG
ncbi:MAG: hypothetical protein HY726_12730 [Candidatus Rokubacteria bacterium]|nr:hypothetical protein [Candidatus Rokubacteria bacterium]